MELGDPQRREDYIDGKAVDLINAVQAVKPHEHALLVADACRVEGEEALRSLVTPRSV